MMPRLVPLARTILAGLGALALQGCPRAAVPPTPPIGFHSVRNLNYLEDGNDRHRLDLYLPDSHSKTPRPLIVFIHGGGWESGDKNDCGLLFPLLGDAFAGASLAYRLTPKAHWPAQIHDCKAALRWLRAHASEYGFDPDRVALFGISAGGHLASLLGTSGGVKELEPDLPTNSPAPVRIRCVLNFCGPSDFTAFTGQNSIVDPQNEQSAIGKLFSGPMREHMAEARAASPITYISAEDPPFLHIQGTSDPIVPYAQTVGFDAALRKAGVASILLSGPNAAHVFCSAELVEKMRLFLAHYLQGAEANPSAGPVAIQ